MASEDDGSDAGPHDPEAELHDPESSLHDPTPDGPRIPDATVPTPAESDVPKELASAFWILVLVVNAAVLALAVGAMFVVFRNDWDLGARLFLAGGILGVYGYYRYRQFPDTATDDGETDPGDEEGSAGGSTPDADGSATAADGPPPETDPPDPPAGATGPPAGTVRDGDGDRYLLVKRSAESSLVRDPASGEATYLPNDDLEPVEGSALEAAAGAVPAPSRRVLSATHDDRSLGLVVELVDRGPLAVRSLLEDYDLCESDLHGLLAEFRAAGLVEETTVAGLRGYEATEAAEAGVERLRDPDRNRERDGATERA